MRKVIYSTLANDPAFTAIVPAASIVERSAVGDGMATPFAVLAWQGSTVAGPGMRRYGFTLYIHDNRGDYSRIDDALRAAEAALAKLVHEVVDGQRVSLVEPGDSSSDLYDEGLRTNTRSMDYRVVGTGL